MNRFKAFFGSLLDTKDSAAYLFWVNILITVISKFAPGILPVLDSICDKIAGAPFSTVAAGMFAYVIGRMTSKAAKLEAIPAGPATVEKK